MSLANEIEQLAKLKASGMLTEEEFQQAKAKLLAQQNPAHPPADRGSSDDSLGHAANRYVSFQIIALIVGIIIFLIFAWSVLPNACNHAYTHSTLRLAPGSTLKLP